MFVDRIKEVALDPNLPMLGIDLETTVRLMPDGSYNPMPRGHDADCPYPFAGRIGPTFLFHKTDAGTAKEDDVDAFILALGTNRVRLTTIYCGHNLKFDLQHLMHHAHRHQVPTELLLWDTMVAEYILTGQRSQMTSLNELAIKYGFDAKVDLIGENLSRGVTPDQIPGDELLEYLYNDVELVEKIARAQREIAMQRGQMELILTQCHALIAYAAAELHGMRLNTEECVKRRDETWLMAAKEADVVKAVWHKIHRVPDWVPTSELIKPRALSMLFFGFPVSADLTFPVPRNYVNKLRANQKNVKYTLQPDQSKIMSLLSLGLTVNDVRLDTGWYRVDEDVLKQIKTKHPRTHWAECADAMIHHRAYSKLADTYYQPLLEHAAKFKDGVVHHTINQCITATGRTSSEQPNAQNMPPEVRDVIVPKVGNKFIEIDFRQLEMCVLAQLSGDPGLIAAIHNGDDIHYMTGELVFNYKSKADETPDLRRIIKTINFGLAYGGGAFTLAEQAGVSVQVAKDAIEAFYTKFPYTRHYNDRYYETVVNTPEVRDSMFKVAEGCTARVHTVGSPTGRRYVYIEQKTPEWLRLKTGANVTFAPTQTKNYPVQGLATGDIVPLFIVLLRQVLRGDSSFVNFVHDSVLLEVPNADVPLVVRDINNAVAQLPTAINLLWPAIQMRVPLNVEVKVGSTWGEMAKVPL